MRTLKYLFIFCTRKQSCCFHYLKKFINFSHADGFGSSGAAHDSERRQTENLRGYRNKVSLLCTYFSYNCSYSAWELKLFSTTEFLKVWYLSFPTDGTSYSYHRVKNPFGLQRNICKNARIFLFKGIDRSFELRCEIRLNRFVMTNWRLGNFFYLILKGQHHKISKKPIDAA